AGARPLLQVPLPRIGDGQIARDAKREVRFSLPSYPAIDKVGLMLESKQPGTAFISLNVLGTGPEVQKEINFNDMESWPISDFGSTPNEIGVEVDDATAEGRLSMFAIPTTW